MADIRTVTPDFAVAPQLAVSDLADAAKLGFALVLNNRPDGEEPGQPTNAAMKAAAEAAGLDYAYIPVVGRANAEQIAAVREAIADAKGPVLAFCRSGTRSITTWALGEAERGGRSREDLVGLGRSAGYDLSGAV